VAICGLGGGTIIGTERMGKKKRTAATVEV